MNRGLAVVLALVLGSSTAWARDRIPPTTPTNLRVTGLTPYSVALAWDPSTDNSGSFSYTICCAYTNSQQVGQQFTSFTYTAGLEASRSFTLRIIAKDAAGNYSKYSNSVTFTTPPDNTPPTKPVVSVTDVGPTHVSLAWSSIEDGPNVWFSIFRDGVPISQGDRSTSAILPLLKCATRERSSTAHSTAPTSSPSSRSTPRATSRRPLRSR